MKITVLYGRRHLSNRDIASFQRAAAMNAQNKSIRTIRFVMIAAGLLAAAAGGLLAGLRGGSTPVVAMILGLLLFLLGVFYYPYLAWTARRRMPRKLTHMVFEFAEDGLHVTNPLQSGTHPYKAFHAIGEGRTCYFLFLTPKDGYFIPKVSVPSSQQAKFGPLLEARFRKKLDHYNF